MKINSVILCDHANEVPFKCLCSKNCYCKKHTCKDIIKKIKHKEIQKPKRPLNRLIRESDIGGCPKCGSSLHITSNYFRRFLKMFGLKVDGCIHPDCENYYKNKYDEI